MVIGTLICDGTYIYDLNVTMVFEFLIFIWIEFHSFAPDTEMVFVPLLFFDNLYAHPQKLGKSTVTVFVFTIKTTNDFGGIVAMFLSTI